MVLFVDPPSGWRYGFPKAVPNPKPQDMTQWLIDNGYPKGLIEKFGKNFYCRYWEEPDAHPKTKVSDSYPRLQNAVDNLELATDEIERLRGLLKNWVDCCFVNFATDTIEIVDVEKVYTETRAALKGKK